MIIGIPHWFTQAEQGYYFTFNSLLGLQVFFELGFNYVVIQLVGHEVAHLSRDENGNWVGEAKYLDRLTSLIHLLRRWYRVIAVLFFAVVSVAGFVFFLRNGEPNVTGWQVGWPLLVLFSAINLYLSPFLAVVEGAGQVGHIARLRLIQSMLGYGMLWLCLNNGAALWAVPLVAMANAIGSMVWLKNYGRFIKQFATRSMADIANKVNWRLEIFPFQWRIALSWMSGYFIFQLFNPIIFAYQGPVAAGQIGLALTIFSTILSVAMSWVTAKAPVLAGHIARKEHQQARALFWSLWLRSGGINLLGCAAVFFAVWWLKDHGFALAYRLPELPVLLCIVVVTLINHFIFSAATYMRAHKEEPLMLSSIVVGVLSLFAVYLGAPQGILITMILYTVVTICIALPWCGVVFYRFIRNNYIA